MSAETLRELGEFALIGELLAGLPAGERVSLGPGDDAAGLEIDGTLLVSTDTLVERVHFKREWSDAASIGRKSVAVNVADIEAMGVRPRAVVMGFSAPGDVPTAWVREFFAGVVAECERGGVALVGGDITSARDITVGVTVMGESAGLEPVRRSGARVGDAVAVRGRLGWAAAGLAVLSRGFRSPRAVVELQRCPEVPYGQGIVANRAGAHAMIDVSDGLVQDLGHVAEASGVGIDLDPAAFVPDGPLQAVAAATGADPMAFMLTGGEDHALAATFAPGEVPDGWRVVGTVGAADADGPRVTLGGRAWDSAGGWDHFRA